MQKPLTVYKASAGSGKTFTLAVEYIKLLIANPYGYSSILAVTFTNKATEEMKTRILSQLYGIANALPDSKAYADIVAHDLQLGERQMRQQAQLALTLLIHHYNFFRVQTIDTFFQSVLRNLARELDLTPNLRIGLNDEQVEELAVDQLIESLDSKSPVLAWIKEYVMDNIREDKSWNVISAIKRFGRNIFNDAYKEHRKQTEEVMSQPDFFKQYTDQLRQLKTHAEEGMKLIAETFFETLHAQGLEVTDLNYKASGAASFFLKLQKGEWSEAASKGARVQTAMTDPTIWFTKKSPRKADIEAIAHDLSQQIVGGEQLRQRLYSQYLSADLTLNHLYQMRLLKAISTTVAQLNADANRFLLSDTQNLLHQLISGVGDSPFIYEKIGSRLEHIMIDEFQDTSTVQWRNFKVLLDECMSHQRQGSLLVGDVKQSIYRWRSGDWQLLNNIEDQFPRPDEQLNITSLQTNYRSSEAVVTFNNAFFTAASKAEAQRLADEGNAEADQIAKAYADVQQRLPEAQRPKGRVEVKILNDDSTDAQCRDVEKTIRRLLDAGVRQNQIAILVRANRYTPILAEWIIQHMPDVSIVSDEAFRLNSSQAVCLIINAMRSLVKPDDQLAKATLVKYWQAIGGENRTDSQCFASGCTLDELLPEGFVEEREQLTTLPFADMVDRIYQLFHLDRLPEQSAFVCAFYDLVADYLSDNVADIANFLDLWDEDYATKSIHSDVADGIRIVSVHKSKGLEYDNVIIPFCDWQTESLFGTLWCTPQEKPFSQLPIVPIDYSSKLKGSIFEGDFEHERLQQVVDNLNILYVAFTRASHNLFVFAHHGNKAGRRTDIMETVLPQIEKVLPGATYEEIEEIEEGEEMDEFSNQEPAKSMLFGYGTLHVEEEKKAKHTDNVFLQPSESHKLHVSTHAVPVEFRQSNKSIAFTQGDDADDPSTRTHYINLGNVLHAVFSRIETRDDIARVMAELEEEGTVYGVGITPDDVRQAIDRGLAQPEVASLFDSHWRVFNECTILTTENGRTVEYRPDRVVSDGQETRVVDFKFGSPRPEHALQVEGYMQLLRHMDYPQVKGYIWYVKANRLVPVEETRQPQN